VGGRIQGLPNFFEYPLLSQERIKLRTSNFVCTFLLSIGTNFGKSSRGRLRGFSKLLRAPIYWAHRAVVFAIARLSCLKTELWKLSFGFLNFEVGVVLGASVE